MKDMAIFHFNNVCLSFVSSSFAYSQISDCLPSMLSCCHLILSFVYMQLLPTLDIYTWTEEHVVSIILFHHIFNHFDFINEHVTSNSFSISGCNKYLVQVCALALYSDLGSLFICCLCVNKNRVCPFRSQGKTWAACRFTPTCLKRITLPGRGCCCWRRLICGIWGSSPKAM